jgi:hypothetical protein
VYSRGCLSDCLISGGSAIALWSTPIAVEAIRLRQKKGKDA